MRARGLAEYISSSREYPVVAELTLCGLYFTDCTNGAFHRKAAGRCHDHRGCRRRYSRHRNRICVALKLQLPLTGATEDHSEKLARERLKVHARTHSIGGR